MLPFQVYAKGHLEYAKGHLDYAKGHLDYVKGSPFRYIPRISMLFEICCLDNDKRFRL
jgi:hypothetical protein